MYSFKIQCNISDIITLILIIFKQIRMEEVGVEIHGEEIKDLRSYLTNPSLIANVHSELLRQTSQQQQIQQNDKEQLSKTRSSSLEWFRDDIFTIDDFDPNDSKYKSKPHEVNFRIDKFVRFFLFKTLFSILGPLSIIVMIFKPHGYVMLKNFHVYGINWRSGLNFIKWIFTVLISYGIFSNELKIQMLSTVIYFIIIILADNEIFSIKMAFFHPSKLEIFEKFPIEKYGNIGEVCIDPILWSQQPENLIESEIEQSVFRNQIEKGQFICFFMVTPHDKLKNNIQHEFELYDKGFEKYAGNGVKMAFEIIKHFNKQSSLLYYTFVAVILTLIRVGIITSVINLYPLNLDVVEQILYVTVMIVQNLFMVSCIVIMLIAFRDLQRKVYSMNQLSHLVSAQKVEEYSEEKLFPSLNFLCVVSLFSWQNLRKILLDYGLQYQKRQNYIISFLIVVAIAFIIIEFILFINFYNIPIEQTIAFQIQLDFDIGLILIFAIMIVFQGARINRHFKIHKELLRKNIFVYQQLAMTVYFKQGFGQEPKNYLFNKLKHLIESNYEKEKFTQEEFMHYSKFIISSIESVYRDLEYEEGYKPFTVLGIAMTNTLACFYKCYGKCLLELIILKTIIFAIIQFLNILIDKLFPITNIRLGKYNQSDSSRLCWINLEYDISQIDKSVDKNITEIFAPNLQIYLLFFGSLFNLLQNINQKQKRYKQGAFQFIPNEKLVNIVESALNRNFAEELDVIPLQLDQLADGLATDFTKGLKEDDFELRSSFYGTSRQPDPPPIQYWRILCAQLMDTKTLLLILSSILEIVIGNLTDIDHTIFIEGIILLTIIIVSCNYLAIIEFQNQKQLQNLKSMMESRKTFNAWRNGELKSLESSQIMVGDILQIQEGLDIPVDCLLLEGQQIQIDESAITGNSDPARKNTYKNCIGVRDRIIQEGMKNQSTKNDVPSPILFSGTKVIQGEGKMLVLAVGGQSILAKISTVVEDIRAEENQSPFEAKLYQTDNKIKNIGLILVTIIFFVSIARLVINGLNQQFGLNDLIAILKNIIIGIILLIFISSNGIRKNLIFSIQYSITRALSDSILVRKSNQFLQLGLVNQICTDKTGTLTQNRMSLTCIWHDKIKQVNPYDYRVDLGQFIPQNIKDYFVQMLTELWQDIGSQSDKCFIKFIEKCGLDFDDIRKKNAVSKRIPFTSSRKRQSVIVGNCLYQYGSTELVLQACTKFHSEQGVIQIDGVFKKNLEEVLENMASQALRTIAVAYKEIQKEDYLEQVNDRGVYDIETSNLTLICFVGIKDVLRPEVPRCIRQMQTAGIKVRMITGDNKLTAKQIGIECGIFEESKSLALEGNEFMNLIGGLVCGQCKTQNCDCPRDEQIRNRRDLTRIKNQQGFDEILPNLDILARSRPEDKYTLVAGLIEKGFVVAVTGDGTNDAPALVKASVGIAMGICSSGIILLDDNFNSVLKGILWSRNIYETVKKFIQFQFTLNLVILSVILIGALFIQQQVLSPIQIIWINLIVDIFASLTLAKEPPSYQLLERKPDNLLQSLINPKMLKHILGQTFCQLLILSFIIFAGDQFIPEIQDDWDQLFPNQLQYKYSNIQILNNNGHYHCDYVNTCTWIASGRMYHLNGDEDYIKFYRNQQTPSRHFTFIFNTLVLMQIFNYLNSRKIQDELNIFNSLLKNYFSLIFAFGVLFAQILLVTFGNVVFGCYPYYGLSITQWALSIAFASGVLIGRLVIRLLPDINIWYGSSNNNRIHINKSKIE
ncbi:hypothetical protein pb186bvf_017708 [Paramecium bursaria]